MFNAFLKAFAQLGDPHFRRPFWKGIGVTVTALLLSLLIGVLALKYAPQTDYAWVNRLLDLLAGLSILVTLTILFPALSLAFGSLFLDDAADAVEALHYPQDRPGQALPGWLGAIHSVRFAILILLLNIAVLPLYLLLIWFPLANVLIYYGLNGYLFGREYFDLVGGRHIGLDATKTLRKNHWVYIYIAGWFIAFLFTIPVLNLLTPLIATAAMTHIYKRIHVIS